MLNEVQIFEGSVLNSELDSSFTNLKLDSRNLSQGDSQGISSDLGDTSCVLV